MVQSFNAYQIHDNASREVLISAEQAINELQKLLVPPGRPRESISTASRDTNTLSQKSGGARLGDRKAGPSTVTPARKTARSASESAKTTNTSAAAQGGGSQPFSKQR